MTTARRELQQIQTEKDMYLGIETNSYKQKDKKKKSSVEKWAKKKKKTSISQKRKYEQLINIRGS